MSDLELQEPSALMRLRREQDARFFGQQS
jgi:hypothetical protein